MGGVQIWVRGRQKNTKKSCQTDCTRGQVTENFVGGARTAPNELGEVSDAGLRFALREKSFINAKGSHSCSVI